MKLDINLNMLLLPLGLTRWFDEAFWLFIHAPFVSCLVWCLISKNEENLVSICAI